MTLRYAFAALLAAGIAASAAAAEPRSGFYGGIAMREQGAEQGLQFGEAGNAGRFAAATSNPQASQALVFGGYRWRNDLALEAAVESSEGYRLPGGGGVGLVVPGASAPGRTVNVDVYGSWSFWRAFSLYGRLGYAQSEATPVYSTAVAAERRARDGLNYGVGLRYDLSRSLGLKLEYARIGTQASDASAWALPDGDQVQFGLQFRF
jgi:opacity protein-like surface antigen